MRRCFERVVVATCAFVTEISGNLAVYLRFSKNFWFLVPISRGANARFGPTADVHAAWASAEIFPGGVKVDIFAYPFQVADE